MIVKSLSAFLFAALVVPSIALAAWQIETVDSSGFVGDYNSLTLDSSGHPHISYSGDGDLKYAHYDGTSWQIETVDVDTKITPTQGLSSIDDTPDDGPALSVNPALIDGNLVISAGLDIGLGGDESTLTNIGLDLGLPTDILKIQLWVDRRLTAAVSNSFSWAVYTSPDNIDTSTWTQVATLFPAPFDTVENHFDITFPRVTTRYIKVVTRPMSPLVPGAAGFPNIFITEVDSTGGFGTGDTSIALDSSDNPHISYCYYDGTNFGLKYAYYDGANWQIETVDSSGSVGEHNSLALDSTGNPHISYWDGWNDDLKYAYHDGANWQIETVDSSGNVGQYPSLALDSSSNPHVSYWDSINEDLKYAHYDGANWQIETVDSTGIVGDHSSLAIDLTGNPHISYIGSTLFSAAVKYAYHDSVNWNFENIDSSALVGYDTSLALDSSDNPRISYFDSYNYHLKYAQYDGANWQIETVDSSTNVGWYNSLALDSSGNPHFSYSDFTNDDLKYAFGDSSSKKPGGGG